MKRIIKSALLVLGVAAIAGYATFSFFSDTETSTGNTFTAGEIDLKVEHQSNGTESACTFDDNFTSEGPIFECTDVKPGDSGEATIKFTLESNPAWACMVVDNVVDSDNGCNDPEIAAESVCATNGDGELDNELLLAIWIDNGTDDQGTGKCDNTYQSGEELLTPSSVPTVPLSTFMTEDSHFVLPVSDNSEDSMMDDPLQPGEHCVGIAWSIDPTAGNDVQTDKLAGDLEFYVEQERNNSNFKCADHFAPVNETQTLTLENETINPTGPWTPIVDTIQGTLTWQGDGTTFNYDLVAQGLQNGTDYSLIYYADPWPGNNPGKFIEEFTTNGSGAINAVAQSIDLGMDLPDPADANFGTGAKIWLVLSSDYNSGNPSTGPMTAWQPDKYLFEGNVYIHYDDTDN